MKQFRKILCIIMVMVLSLPIMMGNTATADNDIKVTLNGVQIQFDTSPVIKNNRTLVPIRAIFEAMGMSVSWNQDTKKILAMGNGRVITMEIGTVIFFSGSSENDVSMNLMDVAPCIIDDRTYVPVRFIAEATGYTVNWNESSRIVEITGEPKPLPTAQPSAAPEAKPTPKPRLFDELGTDYKTKGTVEFYPNTLDIIDFGKFNNAEAQNVTEFTLKGAYETTMTYTTTRDDVLNYISALKSYEFETSASSWEDDNKIYFICDKWLDISAFKQERIKLEFDKRKQELYIDAYANL